MKKAFAVFTAAFLAIGCATVKDEAKDLGYTFKRAVTDYGDEIPRDTSKMNIIGSRYAYVTGRFDGRNEWAHTNAYYNTKYQHGDVFELAFLENPIKDEPYSGYPIYRVNPGKFTLVRYTAGNCISTKEGRVENETLKSTGSYYASVEFEAGKLYYLGDLSLNEGCDAIVADNKMDDAVKYMNDHYPNLQGLTPEKAVVRAGTFFTKK